MQRALMTAVALMMLQNSANAIEVRNISFKQNGNSVTLTYDLLGKPGEKKAIVKTALVINGERYSADKLSLSGDFGSGTPVGLRKKIVWNVIKDMPAGYQGELAWEVDTEAEVDDPFNMFEKRKTVKSPIVTGNTITDPNSRLTWYRHPGRLRKTDNVESANQLVAKLNSSALAGFNDWRVPTRSEIESLVTLLGAYGYMKGQSMYNYLGRVGFSVTDNIRIWAIDKSNPERDGASVYVSSSANANASVDVKSSGRTSYGSSKSYPTGRSVSHNSNRAATGSASANYENKISVSRNAADSGMYDIYLDTSTSYFMKQLYNDMISIIPVRGDRSSDVFTFRTAGTVNIVPE